MDESTAKEWSQAIHAAESRDPNSALAMFPPEEIEQWAVDWHVAMVRSGWKISGEPVVDHQAALRGYLRKAAAGRSRRFKEVTRVGTADFGSDALEWEP